MTGRDSPAVGVSARAAMALGNVALWMAPRPGGQPTGRFVGELCVPAGSIRWERFERR